MKRRMPPDLYSPLMARAIESLAPGLGDAADRPGAAIVPAWLALASVDLPGVLEVSQRAVRLHVVAKARSAGGYRLREHRLDGGDEAFGAPAGHSVGAAPRRDAGTEQRLGDVDVAEPGDEIGRAHV